MESVQPRMKPWELLLAGAKLLQPTGRRQDLPVCMCRGESVGQGAALGSWGICVSQLGPCQQILAETHCWTSPNHGERLGRRVWIKVIFLGWHRPVV